MPFILTILVFSHLSEKVHYSGFVKEYFPNKPFILLLTSFFFPIEWSHIRRQGLNIKYFEENY